MNYSKPELRSNKSNGILIRSGKPTAIFSFVIFFVCKQFFATTSISIENVRVVERDEPRKSC